MDESGQPQHIQLCAHPTGSQTRQTVSTWNRSLFLFFALLNRKSTGISNRETQAKKLISDRLNCVFQKSILAAKNSAEAIRASTYFLICILIFNGPARNNWTLILTKQIKFVHNTVILL